MHGLGMQTVFYELEM